MLKSCLLAMILTMGLVSSALADGGPDDSSAAESSNAPPLFAGPDWGGDPRGADDHMADDAPTSGERPPFDGRRRRFSRRGYVPPYWGGAPYIGEWAPGQPQRHEPPPPSPPQGVHHGLYYY